MKAKYLINWDLNHGQTYGNFYSNNKKQAIKEANEIIKGYRTKVYSYTIYFADSLLLVKSVSKY